MVGLGQPEPIRLWTLCKTFVLLVRPNATVVETRSSVTCCRVVHALKCAHLLGTLRLKRLRSLEPR